jgi:ribosome biogenesis protein UTP30
MSIFSVLPHNPLPVPYDVCLIVKDLEKGTRPDHEQTKLHFENLLKEKNAKEHISEVLPLRELKVEYKEYEAKTKLCHRFDKFLVDDRVARMVPKFLGKALYKRKRFPVPVNLKSEDLPKEIDACLRSAILPLSHHGTCAMVTVGNGEMSARQLAENVIAAAEVLSRRYPGGWKNIRSVHVKGDHTAAVPIHISTSKHFICCFA